MKRIISLLCVACLVLITACSDDKEVGPIFDSVLTPDFTFDDGAEIIAGVDAVQFTDNSTAKDDLVVLFAAFDECFQGVGDESFFAVRAVVGHHLIDVGNGSELLFQND